MLQSIQLKKSKLWVETKNIQTIQWPSVSPDLNPIENVWRLLVRRVYGRNKQFSNLKELETEILSAWENVSPEDIRRSQIQWMTEFSIVLHKKEVTLNTSDSFVLRFVELGLTSRESPLGIIRSQI